MNYLLDTNFISEARRPARLPARVVQWVNSVDPTSWYICVVNLIEIEIGVRRLARRDPAQAAVLREWKRDWVVANFARRTLAIDVEVAELFASFQVPDPRPIYDALLAATAIVHNMTLVTRNLRDFDGMPVRTKNPWDGPS